MIHLFKKVYLASDKVISHDFDRVVISEENGVQFSDELTRVVQGRLLGFGLNTQDMTFNSIIEMFEHLSIHVSDTDKRVIIYCDDSAFLKVICTWYKYIFFKPNKEAIYDMVSSAVFRMNLFNTWKTSSSTGDSGDNNFVDISNFSEVYESVNPNKGDRKQFIERFKSSLSVEILLANYLYNGMYKEDLKSVLKPLIAKDIEKTFTEIREVFFYHFANPRFAESIGLENEYSVENLKDIFQDQSKIAKFFTSDRIWNSVETLSVATSGKNINFEALTADDINTFKMFMKHMYTRWTEYEVYTAEEDKHAYINAITGDFTDAELSRLIDIESEYHTVSGSFFSNDHETVNHYFIQELLKNKNDKEFFKKYVV